MDGFREVVDVCQLCDIGYRGLDWTSEKKVTGGRFVRARLDRALASAEWCSLFPLAAVSILQQLSRIIAPFYYLWNQMRGVTRREVKENLSDMS
jgi:hypothetical protein